MYYIAKLAQAAGLTVLLVAFIKNFPDLMSYRILGVGVGLFLVGWIVNRYLLKT